MTKNYSIQGIENELIVDFFNVIQFGTDEDDPDIIYSTRKRPNETIFYPNYNANAFTISSLVGNNNETIQNIIERGGIYQIDF